MSAKENEDSSRSPSFEELVRGREEEVIDLLKEKDYLDQLVPLQQELVKLQTWAREQNMKIMMIFEGRDAAGKGSTIKRFAEYMNPRFYRVVALDKPTDRERSQWYFQRYIVHLPSGGEICFFDRSWYNRAGVERVMGFCTEDQVKTFYEQVPKVEEYLVKSGIHLTKFWFSVKKKSQEKRFSSRKEDPLKVWKLSPVDQEAQDHWDDYSRARDDMLRRTSTEVAPWTVVRSDNKKLARLNAIRYLLSQFDYPEKRSELLDYDRSIVQDAKEEVGRD